MKIFWDSQLCYGCRACELACSYHHRKAFSPGGGSIQVFKNRENGKIRWQKDETCDFCTGESQPLCVRYCSYQALEIQDEKKKIEKR